MYLTPKLVHLASLVLFLGNVSVGIFWKLCADRSTIAAVLEPPLPAFGR